MEEYSNPLNELRCMLTVSQNGVTSSSIISAPAFTGDVVRAAVSLILAAGHHPDNVLDELERILEDYRGTAFCEIEEDE
jgi:hypothetical protein